ncbi:MAG: phosphatidylglycerol lysyltransferase domain-containing protein [Actinomycetota bacterium]|nr:phosphatidylglycerol lysyltransferase domain-containing protein [Actinomycetota bacterium]
MRLRSAGSAFTVRRRLRLLAFAVTVTGIVNLASALTPQFSARLEIVGEAFTPEVTHFARGATALLGVALVLLGRGVLRHRRLAYRAAVMLLAVSAFTHLLKGLDFEEAVVAIGVAVLLIKSGSLFTASTPPAHWRTTAKVAATVIPVAFAYGILGLVIRYNRVRPGLTVLGAVHETAARLVGLTGPLHVGGGFGRWFPASITALGFCAVIVIAVAMLAPVAERTLAPAIERERIRRLVNREDGDTLDPFALRHDKRYMFSTDGHAAVAYRYVNGAGLASGDPVGDPAAYADALGRFLERCTECGWRPAVIGARGDRLDLYESLGLRARYLGDEAIIDVEHFTLDGRRMRPVRQAFNRTKNFGLTAEIHREGELEPTLRRALIGISERHLDGAPERGFSMALDALLTGRDADCLIVVCRDAEGTPIAFQRYVPCKAGTGLSLDTMRRDDVGPNGVNERLIVEAVLWAREHGIREVSLNFAAFKGLIEEDADLGPLETAQAWLIKRLNPYFQIQSLLTFNAKFDPRWAPRYLVYRSMRDLPPIAVAALSAESFLPFDRGPREPTAGVEVNA